MSSRLFSALTQLDRSLQDVQVQVDWLRAGLEVGDDDLQNSLADAYQKAIAVRDLVRAERPNASWSDRPALEQLMQDLEREAQVRLTEQRRARLLALADELNAGSVRHRFESRASALNSLRLDAIRELRVVAALPDQEKDLPGPEAHEWLHWACNLLEESDSDVFEELRRDFPALETFAVEMEESYWSPGEGGRESFSAPLDVPSRPAPEPTPGWQDWQASSSTSTVNSEFRKPPHNVRVPGDAVVKTGGGYTAAAVAMGYDAQASAAPSLAEPNWATEEKMPWQQAKAMEEEEVQVPPISAPPMKVCDQCGMSYSNGFHTCTAEHLTLHQEPPMPATMTPAAYPSNGKNGSGGNGSASFNDLHLSSLLEAEEQAREAPAADAEAGEDATHDPTRENAELEFHRLKAIVEQRYAEEAEKESAKKEETLFLNLTAKQLMIYGSAVAVILVAAILLLVHHFNAKSAEAAATVATAKIPVVLPDPDMQKEIVQRLSSLKDSTIDVTVQNGVVTLSGKSPSEEEAIQAEDLAMQTNGVKIVRDRLQVDSKNSSNSKPRAGKPAQH
ncbi:MAG TPA: BON domain-containing protein [Verrucomicrobiae bacterium]|jgi:BON domain|nr:BON domain-containing protein [Verrucomicrobiae bacterium]